MKLEEVKKVKLTLSEQETNQYLQKGYQLLKILSTKSIQGEKESVQPSFILGSVQD